MPIMQITNKERNSRDNRINLILTDTAYEEQTKLIDADQGRTLETVQSGDTLDEGLLTDILAKQNEIYSKLQAYFQRIDTYMKYWNFGNIADFIDAVDQGYVFNPTANIAAGEDADNTLKNILVQNELYFGDMRNVIILAMEYLKNKHEERINMAIGDIRIKSKGNTSVLHPAQKKILFVGSYTCDDGTNAFDNGDYKYLRSPHVSGYSGSGDISITFPEQGTLVTKSGAATLETLTEPAVPNAENREIEVGGSPVTIGTSDNFMWVKWRFPNGFVAQCIYQKGVAAGQTPGYNNHSNFKLYSPSTDRRIYNNTGSTVYYAERGAKPLTGASSITSGNYIVEPTLIDGVGKVYNFASVASATVNDARFVPDFLCAMPFGSNAGLTLGIVYDLEKNGEPSKEVVFGDLTGSAWTLDGKSLISGYYVYDTEDWANNPIYKPVNSLALDDIIRVYPT